MTARDHRPKASELFQGSPSPFVTLISFGQAFPEIEEVVVEIEHGEYQVEARRTYRHPPDRTKLEWPLGEYIDCGYDRCYGGGFSIGNVLRDMVKERSEHAKGTALCKGNEASPKGRRVYRHCMRFFAYEVRIKYRPPSAGGDVPAGRTP